MCFFLFLIRTVFDRKRSLDDGPVTPWGTYDEWILNASIVCGDVNAPTNTTIIRTILVTAAATTTMLVVVLVPVVEENW